MKIFGIYNLNSSGNSKSAKHSTTTTFGNSNLSSKDILFLHDSTKKFPKDIDYRRNLLANSGMNPNEHYRLQGIVGPQEYAHILRQNTDNQIFYSSGENNFNVKKNITGANTHVHTVHSDGALTPETLLEKARVYADKVAKKPLAPNKTRGFITGITDHDTVDGAIEAMKIVYDNPLRYKNLGVVLGIEHTAYDMVAPNIFPELIDVHVLNYGIDPTETTFAGFLNAHKMAKSLVLGDIMDKVNDAYKKIFSSSETPFSQSEAESLYKPLRKNIIGCYNHAKAYIDVKIMLKEVVLKDETLVKMLKENGLEADASALVDEIRKYNRKIDKNNMAKPALETISEFLSNVLKTDKNDIADFIKSSPSFAKYEKFWSAFKPVLDSFKIGNYKGPKYLPNIADVYASLKNQHSAKMVLAHPLERVSRVSNDELRQEYIRALYEKFASLGKEKAFAAETYYQSYKPLVQAFADKYSDFLKQLAQRHRLLNTGSADSHALNIFRRH